MALAIVRKLGILKHMNRVGLAAAVVLAIALVTSAPAQAQTKKITFTSQDGLPVTADLYLAHKDLRTPFVVLFHQAGWSRGEYREIAPRLNLLGFNALAVDQRSGGSVKGVTNETHYRAKKQNRGTSYVDAYQDMVAAVRYARSHYVKGKLVVWGSSYSAALVIKLAGDHPDLVDGVVSFSPGEYFSRFGKPSTWIRSSAAKIHKPVFVTSGKHETGRWTDIFVAIPSKSKIAFVPSTKGNHGSRALWSKFSDSKAYWQAVTTFLNTHFAPATRLVKTLN